MKKNNVKKKNNLKDEKKKIENNESFNIDFFKALYVFLGVICVFCIFYLVTIFVLNKDTEKKDDDVEVAISLDSTIVGRSLTMPEDKYYVLYYETKNEEVNETYSSIVNNYIYSTEEHTKLYTVDMSDALNKKYAKEESNTKPETAKDIAIKGTTLMLIEDGKVTDYIEDQDRIKELLS